MIRRKFLGREDLEKERENHLNLKLKYENLKLNYELIDFIYS